MLIYAVIGTLVVALLIFLACRYFRNHCLECKKRTDWDKYDSCKACNAEHEARVSKHREEMTGRMIAVTHEVLAQSRAETEEFGFSDYDFLDRPCMVCSPGRTTSHRELFRERGLAGNPQACQDYYWNTHVPLARKAHKDRESKKFWKRWLYIPPTKEEEEAVSRVSWWLKNALSAGRDDLAQLREYRTYHEKPDHWMDMTTKQLMERRLSRAKKALDLNIDR
ncbi:MAG: hypothetical protein A2845_02685 [Candidatus Lloydbacteria bacterium RIFCSPHIGHO2_01_FULL_49_22]|uniref:Uncharacterized protein n=1 Tax=Candidatus Lloydbacteria bacterium RIFCSPHIGHO2_01_FULL_49_22 TaxID=1798658 RepID=A0A1G2CV23_9BACT|nr:MAG: hypothetical protein A2845_02685 [Candidatus Lloydbacteria bacterium RIFCSPHIGHO2_01_FULL_49_22]OGZ10355.1 MAG: hypothetical protein A3C14_02385 [Candidatus Lloydbacteria bacterium RIFCSPHIGHO2_02_FULL_50_18]